MDKSFNDQELSDIMKEIEALEEDFATSDATSSPVMEELASLNEEVAVPVAQTATVSEFKPKQNKPAPAAAPGTSMNFKVQGDITLSLQFDIGGKSVSLEVTESGLDIEMDGGMKFTVPLAAKKAG